MRRWWLPLAILALAACGEDVGPTGAVVGGPCLVNTDCAPSSRCLTGGDFPGGSCAVNCASDADCPGGAACVSSEGGVCLLACVYSTDCRGGYVCKGKSRKGLSGEALVCIKD